MGEVSSYRLLKECKGIELFLAFEEVQEKVMMDYVGLSDCHLMIFRPELQPTIEEGKLHVTEEEKIDSVRLVLYADIQSVCEVRISRS